MPAPYRSILMLAAMLPAAVLLVSPAASMAGTPPQATAEAAANAPAARTPPLKVAAGDVFVQHDDSGAWHPIEILLVDTMADGTPFVHVRVFNDARTRPDLATAKALGVRTAHAQVLASMFEKGWERIGHAPPTKTELAPLLADLKFADFPKYLKLTGENPDLLAKAASEHYDRAVALSDQGHRDEAIAEYSRAINTFPLFFEAFDNRGWLFLDAGRPKDALADFDSSLAVNPEGDGALLGKAECLLKLGQPAQAEKLFGEGVKRFPKLKERFEQGLEEVRKAQAGGGK